MFTLFCTKSRLASLIFSHNLNRIPENSNHAKIVVFFLITWWVKLSKCDRVVITPITYVILWFSITAWQIYSCWHMHVWMHVCFWVRYANLHMKALQLCFIHKITKIKEFWYLWTYFKVWTALKTSLYFFYVFFNYFFFKNAKTIWRSALDFEILRPAHLNKNWENRWKRGWSQFKFKNTQINRKKRKKFENCK